MRRHTVLRAALPWLVLVSTAGPAVLLSGCYTQLATVRPDSDLTRATSGGDSEEYFAPERRQGYTPRYLEDVLFDPYYSGLSYQSGGYGDYYGTPWWWERWYPGGTPSGGSAGSPTTDRDRDLWRTGPPPPPVPSGGSSQIGSTGSGQAQGTTGARDSVTTQEKKKQPKRRLWK